MIMTRVQQMVFKECSISINCAAVVVVVVVVMLSDGGVTLYLHPFHPHHLCNENEPFVYSQTNTLAHSHVRTP